MKRRPFSELTKHFTVEDWAIVDAETERIRKELDQRSTPAQEAASTSEREPAVNSRAVSAKGAG